MPPARRPGATPDVLVGGSSVDYMADVYVKMRATLRHDCIDGEDATLEARQNLIVYPCADNRALRRVPARNLKRAQLDFEYGDG
jgi:hypothetical protein